MGTINAEALALRLSGLGLSARLASTTAGLPENFVGRILRGKKADPGCSKVIALCDVLGLVDVRKLYDGKEGA